MKKLSVEEAGVKALELVENSNLSDQEQAFFVAGFQECIKYLDLLIEDVENYVKDVESKSKVWNKKWKMIIDLSNPNLTDSQQEMLACLLENCEYQINKENDADSIIQFNIQRIKEILIPVTTQIFNAIVDDIPDDNFQMVAPDGYSKKGEIISAVSRKIGSYSLTTGINQIPDIDVNTELINIFIYDIAESLRKEIKEHNYFYPYILIYFKFVVKNDFSLVIDISTRFGKIDE